MFSTGELPGNTDNSWELLRIPLGIPRRILKSSSWELQGIPRNYRQRKSRVQPNKQQQQLDSSQLVLHFLTKAMHRD